MYCPICLDTINLSILRRKENIKMVCCKNIFHVKCLNSYFSYDKYLNRRCPLCRSFMINKTIKELYKHPKYKCLYYVEKMKFKFDHVFRFSRI